MIEFSLLTEPADIIILGFSPRGMERIPQFLVAGLGNITHPMTRHSVGHLIIDSLAARFGVRMTFNSSTDCWEGTKIIQVATNKKSKEPMSVEFTFAKPKPLMNLSGHAVISSFRKHVSPPSSNHLLVIHDSLEHEPLKISPKNGGSAQGHNGVRSVISSLREDKFYRIRIGIGRGNAEVDRHVLGRLSKSEQHFWSVEGLNPIWQHVERIVLVTT